MSGQGTSCVSQIESSHVHVCIGMRPVISEKRRRGNLSSKPSIRSIIPTIENGEVEVLRRLLHDRGDANTVTKVKSFQKKMSDIVNGFS